MKKALSLIVFITLIVHASTAQNCLSGWSYQTPVLVDNTSNVDTLWDYQVKVIVNTQVLINAGKMQSNGEDLRFSDGSCCGLLCFSVDSGMNTTATLVWVKVPMIPANDTLSLTLAYGNLLATSTDDPECTFEFFDDFNDTSFDLVKWQMQGTPTSLVETGGTVAMAGSSNWEYFRSTTSFTDPVVIHETRMAGGSSTANVLGYTGTDQRFTFRGTGAVMGTTHDPDVNGSNSWFNNGYPATEHPLNVFYDYEIIAEMSGNNILVSSYCNTTTNNCNLGSEMLNQYTGTSFYIGFSAWNTSSLVTVDRVFVRKYSNPEPASNPGIESSLSFSLVDLGADTTFCGIGTFNIDAGAGFSSYTWSTGDTIQTIIVDTSGSYYVDVTDTNGCVSTDTIIVNMLPAPTADFSSLITNLTVDFTDISLGANSWSWDFGDLNNSNLQNPTHAYASSGTYYVCLTAEDIVSGCQDVYCDSILVTAVGIAEMNKQSILIYPNPATEKLYLEMNTSGASTIRIFNLYGQKVFASEEDISPGKRLSISINELDAGTYYLFISSGNMAWNKKFSVLK